VSALIRLSHRHKLIIQGAGEAVKIRDKNFTRVKVERRRAPMRPPFGQAEH